MFITTTDDNSPAKYAAEVMAQFAIQQGVSKDKVNEWQDQLKLDGLLENVHFKGRKSGENLSKWVASSAALVYVSYFEGFGLPVLEGMMAGVPVLTSNVTSMPEVGAESVIYADPFSISSISDGFSKIVKDDNFDKFRTLGLQQSKLFSWDRSAQEIENLLFK